MTCSEIRDVPSALDAERAVLGSCLLNPEALDTVGPALDADDFILSAHRVIWVGLLRMRKHGAPIDPVTLGAEIGPELKMVADGVPGLLRLANEVPTWHNVMHYASLVREAAVRRRLQAVGARIAALAGSEDDLETLLAAAEDEVRRVATGGRPARALRASETIEGTLAKVERRSTQGGIYGYPTGIAKLDDVVGQLQGGNLVVIGGRPGDGKTSMAINMLIRGALLGLPGILFSLEMSRDEVNERIVSMLSGVPVEAIHCANPRRPFHPGDWDAINRAQEKINRLPLWVDDRTRSLGRIVSEARRWWASIDPKPATGLIAADYCQLVRPDRTDGRRNRDREIAEVTEGLKGLAKSLGLPVVLMSQLNRDSVKDGERPRKHHLRESGSLENDADVVILIYQGSAGAELVVDKNRAGMTGLVQVDWHAPTNTFSDVVKDERQTSLTA